MATLPLVVSAADLREAMAKEVEAVHAAEVALALAAGVHEVAAVRETAAHEAARQVMRPPKRRSHLKGTQKRVTRRAVTRRAVAPEVDVRAAVVADALPPTSHRVEILPPLDFVL